MTRASGVSIVSTGNLFTKSLTYRILKKTGSLSCSSSALQKIDTGLRGWCLRALAMFSCNRPFQSCGLLWREEYYKVEKFFKRYLGLNPITFTFSENSIYGQKSFTRLKNGKGTFRNYVKVYLLLKQYLHDLILIQNKRYFYKIYQADNSWSTLLWINCA